MFSYSKDIKFDVVLPRLKASNLRQVYMLGAQAVAQYVGVSSELLLARMQEPSRLRKACMGDGVVVADMKVAGLKAPILMLSTLCKDVEFCAPDGQDVNVFCMVLSPESQSIVHLRLVSRVVRLLKNPDVRMRLAQARGEQELRAVLGESEMLMMAA